jgi:hypothetical protein
VIPADLGKMPIEDLAEVGRIGQRGSDHGGV